MIKELTKEQEEKLEDYANKWINIGLNTKKELDESFLDYIEDYYKAGGLEGPDYVIVCPSIEGALRVDWSSFNSLNDQVNRKVRDKVDDKVRDKVRDKVNDKVHDKVRDKVNGKVDDQVNRKIFDKVYAKVNRKVDDKVYGKVNDKVDDQVYRKVDDKVYDKVYGKVRDKVNAKVHHKVRAKVYDKVRDKVDDKVNDQVDDQVYRKVDDKVYRKVYDQVIRKVDDKVFDKVHDKVYRKVDDKVDAKVNAKVHDKVYRKVDDNELNNDIWTARCGLSLWSGYKGYIDFYLNECGLDLSEYLPTLKLSEQFSYAFPFSNVLILVEQHSEIKFDENGELHCENGPAISWEDGTAYNFLNGVSVPDWLFDGPKEELNPEDILNITNVDHRTKVVQWYGLEHLLDRIPYTVVDEKTESNSYKTYTYKLLKMELIKGFPRNYLYMENPSCDEKHVEAVIANTVDEALMFRVPDRQKQKYGYKQAIARA